MIVLKLTDEQKVLIEGREYARNSLFNPIQDGNEPPNWVITTQEAEQCTNLYCQWVKDLPEIEWVEPVNQPDGMAPLSSGGGSLLDRIGNGLNSIWNSVVNMFKS